jgi:hypothetical protein
VASYSIIKIAINELSLHEMEDYLMGLIVMCGLTTTE